MPPRRDPGDGRPGGTPVRPALGPRLGGILFLWGPPAAPLLAPSLLLRENSSRKFADDSEKFPRTTFLKQKDGKKLELALGIFLIV